MVTFNELLKTPELDSSEIIAGADGLDHKIKTISVMDAPDSHKWLRGGELILTSGFLYSNDNDLLLYIVEKLIAANCAGLGIKKDRYLKEIPDEVIQTANENAFPIIHIPYALSFPDITEPFNRLYYSMPVNQAENKPSIIKTDNSQIYTDLLDCLSKGEPINNTCEAISELQKPSQIFSCIIIISSPDTKKVYRTIQEILTSCPLEEMGKIKIYAVFGQPQNAIVLLNFTPKDQIEPHRCQYWLSKELYNFKFDGHISAGRFYSDINDIGNSYIEATEAMVIGGNIVNYSQCYLYYSMSYLCVLYRDKTSRIDLSLIDGFMLNQDKICPDALKTLEACIECRTIEDIAKKLYRSESAAKARIRKLEDYFCFNLLLPTNKLTLSVLLTFWRLKNQTSASAS